MLTLDQPADLVDNVGLILSASDYNQIRRNTIFLDRLSFRRHPCIDSTAGADTGAADLHTAGDFRLWWGSLRYRTGMTDLVVAGNALSPGPAELKVYVNGVDKATITPTSSWTETIDISTGYAVNSVLDIEIRTLGNNSKTSVFVVKDVYATPVVVSETWPTILTFAGVYGSAYIQALINATEYLFARMNAVPIPASVAHIWAPATHKNETHVLWHGAVQRNYADEVLKLKGHVQVNNVAEHYIVNLNGVTVLTSSTYNLGDVVPIDTAIDLSAYTAGARVQVGFKAVVTNSSNQPSAGGGTNSRYTLNVLRAQAGASGYSVTVPPAELARAANASQSSLDTKWNALGTMLTAIKARLDGRPELWNRVHATRRRYAQDGNQLAKLNRRHPLTNQRLGDRAEIHGKGVSIGWGAPTVKSKEGVLDYDDYAWMDEQQIIGGDNYESVTVNLDSLPGLYPGMSYFIFGQDVVHASEYLI